MQWSIIDTAGRRVIEDTYENLAFATLDRVRVQRNQKWGVIDARQGDLILPFEYDEMHTFVPGCDVVGGCKDEEWRLIGIDGRARSGRFARIGFLSCGVMLTKSLEGREG